jgi:GTP pyrophosphokinase
METNFFKSITYPDDIIRTQKEVELRTILKSYHTLYKLALCQSFNKNEEFLKLLKKAFRFILQVYQKPNHAFAPDSVFHAIEIAIITAEKFRLGAKSIVCALLHDILKDKKVTELTLRKEFGTEVTAVVVGLTKVAGITFASSNSEVTNLRPVLNSFSPDNLLMVLIKFAEYLRKMYIIEKFSREKQLRLAEEAASIYIPLAHNLGLDNVYLELKDLYLKFKHRIVYDAIVKKLKATKTTKEGFLQRFTQPICEELQKEGIGFSLKGRTKSIASICHKIKERNFPFEAIHDFYAVRIVFESSMENEYSNCWAVYELVTNLYEPKLSHLRDWVSYPRETGYEALHITVMSNEGQWVEVQIRAKRMDDNAEHGKAAHWKYKSSSLGKEFEKMDKKWLEKARRFLSTHRVDKQQNEVCIVVNKIYVNDYIDE